MGSEDGVVEGVIGGDRGRVERFLNGMYGGRTSGRRKFMVPEKGVDLELLRGEEEVGRSPFFEEEVSCCLLSFGRFLFLFWRNFVLSGLVLWLWL